ncbi:MAG: sugar phosphate isomerase/epimerase [Bryobacteraceae bacterium]
MLTHNRRSFVAGALALASPRLALPQSEGGGGFILGVASYSLRKFSRTQAIAMLKEMNVDTVSIKEFHLPYKSSKAELEAGRKEFDEAGIRVASGGVIGLTKNDDADIRMYFEYAKTCRMPMIIIAPTHETMPKIESFVKEYNIKVAIHNHGPEDKHFPAPQDALRVIKGMDRRIGVCIDAGHTVRTNTDVIKSIVEAGDRLFDMHIKDLRSLSGKDSQCAVGEGAMPIAAMFKQLRKMNYRGTVNLEYEIKADAPLPGMKESFSYMRGVLAGLKA